MANHSQLAALLKYLKLARGYLLEVLNEASILAIDCAIAQI